MKKGFVKILKFIIQALFFCFVIPFGIIGVIGGLIWYPLSEGYYMVQDELDNAK